MIKISKKLMALLAVSVTFTGLNLSAQGSTNSSRQAFGDNTGNFYTNRIPARTMDIVADFDVNNRDNNSDSEDVQDAINTLADLGGGTLTFPRGDYRIQGIRLRSNIRLRFRAGATVTARFTGGRNFVFEFGGGRDRTAIRNVEIRGESTRSRLRINLLNGDRRRNVQFFNLVNVENVRLAFITMNDIESSISGITSASETFRVLVESVDHNRVSRGFGVMQVRTGRRFMFRDIEGDAGTAFRVETGNDGSNPNRTVGEVFGRGVRNNGGGATIFSRPDGQRNGFFDVRGVTSRSCTFLLQANGDSSSFQTSFLRGMRASSGTTADVRSRDRRLIPCENRNLSGNRALRPVSGPGGGEFLMGPPIGVILRRAGGAPYLRFDVRNDISTTGFFLNPARIINEPADQISNCPGEGGGGNRRRNRRRNRNN